MATATHRLQDVLAWVHERGEVKAVHRLRLKLLIPTLKEGLDLTRVGPETECSARYFALLCQTASEITGEPCPF